MENKGSLSTIPDDGSSTMFYRDHSSYNSVLYLLNIFEIISKIFANKICRLIIDPLSGIPGILWGPFLKSFLNIPVKNEC